MGDVVVDPKKLQEAVGAALQAAGVPHAPAAAVATILVRTDARNVRTHGVSRLPGYVDRLRQGGIVAAAQTTVAHETTTTAVLDAGGGFGYAAAARATELAIEKASSAGTAVVLVRNSNHCGAMGHYALLIAEAGLIGLATTNAPLVMGAPGARGPVIGNQPIAWGAPAPGGPPLVFDAAMSVVSGTAVYMAAQRGEPVPSDWLTDEMGNPTADASAFTRGGALSPIGGHKGYGLGLVSEVLAGALSGASLLSAIVGTTNSVVQDVGHAFIAIDPSAFMDRVEFLERVGQIVAELRGHPAADGTDGILLPGDLENRSEARVVVDGLGYGDQVWQNLLGLADELGVRDRFEAAVVA